VIAKPDPLIHPITRLSICGLLAAGADWGEFAALRDAAGISDSVLSKQSRVLEDAGYVEVRKGAVGPSLGIAINRAAYCRLCWAAPELVPTCTASRDHTTQAGAEIRDETSPDRGQFR
jgi:hypothetical protein